MYYSFLVDHGKDLETYLEYCKDVVFAGVEQSFEDHEEDQIIEDLWNFYQMKEVHIIYQHRCPNGVLFTFVSFVFADSL